MDSSSETMVTRAAVRPGFSAGHFALEIDGQAAGYLSAVEGGEAVGEVVVLGQGKEPFASKSIGAVSFTDVVVSADLSLEAIFYTWISDTLQGRNLRRDVAVLTLDADSKVRRRDDFYNALITEVTVPKLDGSSKDLAFLSVKFSPEYVRNKKGDVSKYKAPASPTKKRWVGSNFRLDIAGLDCSKVNAIDAITIKQTVAQDPIGEQRDNVGWPAKLEFPNLTVTLTEAGAETFFAWHEDFVIKGNNTSDHEKKGVLTILAPDLKISLAVITFSNLGIFRLSRGKRETGSEQIPRVKAELYVEQIDLALSSAP
jgi:phage tail-like protein